MGVGVRVLMVIFGAERWHLGREVLGKDVCKLVEECIHLGVGVTKGWIGRWVRC